MFDTNNRLLKVLLRRPANPIGFISEWLLRYNGEDDHFDV